MSPPKGNESKDEVTQVNEAEFQAKPIKRGRPKKVNQVNQANSQTEPTKGARSKKITQVNEDEIQTEPTKRGRPKKINEAEPPNESSKRGRPKKLNQVNDDAEPQAGPAKRGRPTISASQNELESTQKTTKKLGTLSLQEKTSIILEDQPPTKKQKTIKKGANTTTSGTTDQPKAEAFPTKNILKPLFSAQALRSNFNPLPQTEINFSSNEIKINQRCENILNSFTFKKYEWKKNSQTETPLVLIFGAGDMGQMGLGPEKLDDVRKPTIHQMIEDLRKSGEFATPVHLAAGGMHTLVVDSHGKIWSWGINDNAALGRKTEGIEGVEQEQLETCPMNISSLSPLDNSLRPHFKAARVSAGDSVSVAVSDAGELVAWGSFRSNDGLLGFDGKVGTSPKQLIPTRVSNLRDYPVAQVVCGYDHVLALTTDGHVYSWGNGQQQQLGRKIIERRKKNGLTPERLALKKIVLVGTGGSHSFAVNEDGVVYGWGLNTRGQLGISSEESCWENEIVSIPTPVRAMSPDKHNGARVIAIEGGDFHTLFLLNNGQVWAVGSYENGEVGVKLSAREILEVEKERKEGIAKKGEFIEEEMKSRKARFEKRLARYTQRTKEKMEQDDDLPPRWDEMNEQMEAEQEAASRGFVPGRCLRAPVRLEFPHPIIDISCGTRHNLAVDNQGNAYSWGLGQSNELGQGKDKDGEEIELLESPKLLTSKALSDGKLKVVQCAAGGTHSLLIAVNVLEPEINGKS